MTSFLQNIKENLMGEEYSFNQTLCRKKKKNFSSLTGEKKY